MGYFFTKSPKTWLPFWSKNLKVRVPFHENVVKIVKSAIFEAENPLETGSDFQKKKKIKKKKWKIKKSLEKG